MPFLFFPQSILKCYFCSLFNFFSFYTHLNSKNLFQSFLHFQSTKKRYWTKNGSVSISLFIYSIAICQTNIINLRNTDFLFTWVLNLRSNPFCFCFLFHLFIYFFAWPFWCGESVLGVAWKNLYTEKTKEKGINSKC